MSVSAIRLVLCIVLSIPCSAMQKNNATKPEPENCVVYLDYKAIYNENPLNDNGSYEWADLEKKANAFFRAQQSLLQNWHRELDEIRYRYTNLIPLNQNAIQWYMQEEREANKRHSDLIEYINNEVAFIRRRQTRIIFRINTLALQEAHRHNSSCVVPAGLEHASWLPPHAVTIDVTRIVLRILNAEYRREQNGQ